MLGPRPDAVAPLGVTPLGRNELHVWSFGLDVAPQTLADASELLTPQERTRFERILTRAARARRMTARAGVRLLLGSYLGIDPLDVRIAYGARGRPELLGGGGLRFNLSHTADLAVCAIGRGRAIGVDIESLERDAPSTGLLDRTLDRSEAGRVMRLRGERERAAAFLRYWTVKEAYAKALGLGLELDFRTVGVRGGERPRLALPAGAGEWSVRRLRPRPDVVGAVVADGGAWRLRPRQFSLQ